LHTDQIGLTPEEVISKIMANPEVAMAFQNPKVQEAIMDVCYITASFLYYIATCYPPNIFLAFAVLTKSFKYCKVSK